VFGRDTRFKYKREIEQLKARGPGPGAYNSETSFIQLGSSRVGFGTSEKITNVVYHKELQGSYLSKHSPGPGTYDSKHFFSDRKQGGKINPPSTCHSRTKTRFKHAESLSMRPLEDHSQFIALKKKNGKVKIGTEPRRYDPIFYSAQNKEFIIKGLR